MLGMEIAKGMGGIVKQLSKRGGSYMAVIMLVSTFYKMFFPRHIGELVRKYLFKKLTKLFNPYIQITFSKKSEAYTAIQTYLSENSTQQAARLKAKELKPLVLRIDDNEEITDEFERIKVCWDIARHGKEKRLRLTYHRRYRDIITSSYIKHVMDQGNEIALRYRNLKLYTNSGGSNDFYKPTKWRHIRFEHPAVFETLAMDPDKKEEIIKDLEQFRNGREYYAKVGKAWKRGYLLYGPPGTGKSTMIAAIANYMHYDVYDLELTTVKGNTALKNLLLETTSKSIIVIEDIDCSLDLTGQRKQNKPPATRYEEEKKEKSTVTLSGLLNFIDGIWSSCGGERIIIFTTNFVDKLDPALIRRGRMDKHIEMSYCSYQAFKVLAKNYLGVDDDSHSLFPIIEKLLGEANMSPADVAENLIPKSATENTDTTLQNLIQSLENVKEEANKKAEARARRMIEKKEEAKLKAEKDKEGKARKEEVKCSDGKSEEE